MPFKILNVVGARPNFMKIAPIIEELEKDATFESRLVHTGQHYDDRMSKFFFEDLGLPRPDIYLEVGSGTHGYQTGMIMVKFEEVMLQEKPDLVVVVGDVNSTIACGLVAVKQGVPLAHVESGLRSFDRDMPEEINRVLTDQISELLFVTEEDALRNLKNEGISDSRVHFVGNVMIDTLLRHRERASQSAILETLGVEPGKYAAVTLHRPSNVDAKTELCKIMDALAEIQESIPVVFPVHPRTRKRMMDFGLAGRIEEMSGLKLTEPLGYLDFLQLMAQAKFVISDSGGVQEETTVLGVPCLTVRENTERPVTTTHGTNIVIGNNTERILAESKKILRGEGKVGDRPHLWDGAAAQRIVAIFKQYFTG